MEKSEEIDVLPLKNGEMNWKIMQTNPPLYIKPLHPLISLGYKGYIDDINIVYKIYYARYIEV